MAIRTKTSVVIGGHVGYIHIIMLSLVVTTSILCTKTSVVIGGHGGYMDFCYHWWGHDV